jgi:hypothetical protein
MPITIKLNTPDGQTRELTTETNDQWGHYLLEDYAGFDKLGVWTMQAHFSGDGAYQASVSPEIAVQVAETAGYAIIIQGKIQSGEGLAAHNKTTNLVYRTLRQRGLLDEDIKYYNYDKIQEKDIEIDDIPSKSAIRSDIIDWASERMNHRPANLYIVLLDHGFEDEFYIFDQNNFDISDNLIRADEFSRWLDQLQAKLSAEALHQEIITVLGFCRSGSFLNELADNRYRRVSIASAAADEASFKGPFDKDGIRQGEFFVAEFFKAALHGHNIKAAFEKATALTEAFTADSHADGNNPLYQDNAVQHPLLDDNGDGIGSNLLNDTMRDGHLSHSLYIGASPRTSNDPENVFITDVTDTLFIGFAENTASLWATVNNNRRLDTLWIEIKPPDFQFPDTNQTEQPDLNFRKEVLTYDSIDKRYEYDALDGFNTPGTYIIYYFAKDAQTGLVSPFKQTTVYKARTGNAPPLAFNLDPSPSKETQLTSLILDWDSTVDPDDDPLTYTVLLSKGDGQFSNPIRLEGLKNSACIVRSQDGIEDLSTYFWKVQAIDIYGGIQESEVSQFDANNTNPAQGFIGVFVYDASTLEGIENAQVKIQDVVCKSVDRGHYLCSLKPGTYPIKVSAPQYTSAPITEVKLPEGNLIQMDFQLIKDEIIGVCVMPWMMLLLD